MILGDRLMIRFDPAEVGVALAAGNDEEQAAFCEAFSEALRRESQNLYAVRKQMECIGERLPPRAREVWAMLPELPSGAGRWEFVRDQEVEPAPGDGGEGDE